MRETEDDVRFLQQLLDRSYAAAGEHLRSIQNEATRLDARRLCEEMTGMQVLVVATVTGDGRPMTGAVDGLFYRGRLVFGSSPTSVRARHLARSPAVSATHARGEDLVVTAHGLARSIDPAGHDDGGFAELARDVYGQDWGEWGVTAPYWEIEPNRLFAADLTVLQASGG